MNGTPHNTSARFVVSLDYIKKGLGDCIPDDRMAEVVKRLVAVIPDNVEQDIVRSEEAPSDKSKFWYQPSTKKLFVYNPSTNAWEETNVDNISVCISAEGSPALLRDEAGCLLLDASKLQGYSETFEQTITSTGSGTITKTLSLETIADDKAAVFVIPLEDLGASARWWVSSQTESAVTVNFAGLSASTAYTIRFTVVKTN